MNKQFKYLPIENLQRGRYQPRRVFEPQALTELGQSIREQGLIEPLIVREVETNRYEIIAGERRWRAAMAVGLTEVPCILGHYSDEQAAAITIIENIQRQDLNLIEEALGYQRLIQEFNYQQENIGNLVGKSRSHIANLLRLLTLSLKVQEMVSNRLLSLGHARMLVGLEEKTQLKLALLIVEKEWSVRRLEEEVRSLKSQSEINPTEDQDVVHLQNSLAMQLHTPVEICKEKNGGWLKIKFFDNETLSGLLERMGLTEDDHFN